jgi:cellulose biosynthesis protein BcsQ
LQGKFKSEGGLDQNTVRIEQSLYLLNSSLELTSGGTPPFGEELSSNIEQMDIDLGYDRILLDATNQLHNQTINSLEISVANLENVNVTETISFLLSQQQTLEASFQAFARIRSVNLSNFLKV